MSTTYVKRSTDSDLSSGGNHNKVLDETTAALVTETISVPPDSTIQGHHFTEAGVPGDEGETGDYTIEVNVTSAQNDIDIAVAVARVDSGGTVQSESTLSAFQEATAGVMTFNLTGVDLGTWTTGDRLRVRHEFRNNHQHSSRDVGVGWNTADSEVITPWLIASDETITTGRVDINVVAQPTETVASAEEVTTGRVDIPASTLATSTKADLHTGRVDIPLTALSTSTVAGSATITTGRVNISVQARPTSVFSEHDGGMFGGETFGATMFGGDTTDESVTEVETGRVDILVTALATSTVASASTVTTGRANIAATPRPTDTAAGAVTVTTGRVDVATTALPTSTEPGAVTTGRVDVAIDARATDTVSGALTLTTGRVEVPVMALATSTVAGAATVTTGRATITVRALSPSRVGGPPVRERVHPFRPDGYHVGVG